MRARISFLLLAFLAAAGCDGKDTTQPGDTADTADTAADTDTTGGTDTTETGTDTGGDPGPYDWSACPGEEAWVGDTTWTGRLAVGDSAVYCSAFSEDRTLEEELAAKALLKVVPGDWPLPSAAGDYDLALPVCTLLSLSDAGPAVAGAGSTTVATNAFSGTTYTTLTGEQPMDLDGAAWILGHTFLLVGDEGYDPDPLNVNGALVDTTNGAGLELTLRPEGMESYDPSAITFGACDSADWTEDVHHLEFDGGSIDLTLRLGDNVSNTAPGSFAEASGTFDGEPFDITSYFQLIYRPGHHHFSRHFAVIFDLPIGDVCALRVEDVDPYAETPTAIVSTADCALTATGTRAVTAESSVIGE